MITRARRIDRGDSIKLRLRITNNDRCIIWTKNIEEEHCAQRTCRSKAPFINIFIRDEFCIGRIDKTIDVANEVIE